MILEEGYLRGSVNGFNNQSTTFTFVGGPTWAQCESKYVYEYQYQPCARVLEVNGQPHIEIDGIDEMVLVKRIS